MRKKIIIANWKLNGNKKSIIKFLTLLNQFYFNKEEELNTLVVMAFPIMYIHLANSIINQKNIFMCAQNVDVNLYGSFTGEISVNMLQDIGVRYVIIGHSERRMYHKENNNIIAKKFKLVKDANLIPILCIGENEKEKKLGQTQLVCQKQLNDILNLLGSQAFENSIIAYEPIWSIGTGQVASLNYIQTVHNFIKNYINQHNNINWKNTFVQYGGSVDENNIYSLISQPDVDGVLIGGASLDYKRFSKIINIIKNY
ncbi:triose-phosphate isomerase [Buchnera aphidicola (Formosaphis micheliae)]|uniref:triose-phosphate isomerase n=1 Tax=Buchnera aphidicola TaxID=9 RepID=UPI0031B8761F